MKRILITLGVVAVAGAAAWHFGIAAVVARPKFRTQQIVRNDLFVGVSATGTIEPTEIIDVGAQIVARVKNFGPDLDKPGKTIDYCSRVEKGTLLVQLDDLLPKSELDKAHANVRLCEADLKNWHARVKQFEADLKRIRELSGIESPATLDKAVADYEGGAAEVSMAEARLCQAKVAVQQAEINLGYTKIASPIEGEVIDRRVNVGQTVVTGLSAPTLFLLARDLRHMQVCAAVNEADVADVAIGQTVTFTVDAYRNKVFSGKVSQIRHNASLNNSVVTYSVIVAVENPDRKLRPYMTASLQFEVARHKNALLVPNQALTWRPTWRQVSPAFRSKFAPPAVDTRSAEPDDEAGDDAEPKVDPGAPTLWVIAKDGFVRPVPVKLGLSDGSMTEILGGEVQPGDRVVTAASQKEDFDFVKSFISHVTDTK